jgi:hypothetical protein
MIRLKTIICIISYKGKADNRLYRRKYRLSVINRKNNKVIAVAIALEMAGFIRGITIDNINQDELRK